MDTKEEVKDLTIVEGRVAQALIAKYDPDKYHVIVPAHVITIPEEVMELGVSIVHISPDPKDRMVYRFPEAGKGMVNLGKRAIEAIANAAGLTDQPSRQVAFQSGAFAIAEATVACTLPTGEIIQRTRQKCIDVDVRVAEYEAGLRERIEKGTEEGVPKKYNSESPEAYAARIEAYVEQRCNKRRLQLQKFMWELANTGAALRAMKALLPALRETYHWTELRKPFVVPRVSMRPALIKNKLLQEALFARARRDFTDIYGPEDLYENLPPDLADQLRAKDAALAAIADEYEHEGDTLLEEISAADAADDLEGWQLLQAAYSGDAVQVTPEVIEEEHQSTTWPIRPWAAETLKRFLDEVKVPSYKGKQKEASEKQLDYVRSLLGQLAPDAADCHTITLYLFGVESTGDLTAAQCGALIDWIGATPPDYEPSTVAIEEAKAIVRQYRIDQGQGMLPI